MDCRVAEVTVRVVESEAPPYDAPITDVPGATLVTRPCESTVATAVVADVQVAELVTSSVEPSDKVAVAVSWRVFPLATLGETGVMVRAETTGAPTVTSAWPD
jgi:hypothetical protein